MENTSNVVVTTEQRPTFTVAGVVETVEAVKRGRGRPKGARGVCSVCGQVGHNKRTCPTVGDQQQQ